MSATTLARAWAVTRRDGVVLGFTDHDAALEFEGVNFRPDSGLSAGALVQGTGLSVDNSEVLGALSDAAIREDDLLAGLWDGAEMRMWEVDWRQTENRRLLFRGSLGEISCSDGAFRAELRGMSEALSAAQGRVYHRGCPAMLGDPACGVDLSDAAMFADVALERCEGGRLFRFAASGFDAGWFQGGILQVLDGAAAGLHGVIKRDMLRDGGWEVELWRVLGREAASGDLVRVIAGCDKRAETCRSKFRNFINFRGFPHLPSEDWLLAPQAGRDHG